MERTEGSVTRDFGDYKVENMLFTYDESEQEKHMLDKINADVVLNPYFIPLNPRMLQNGYSFVEASIFGFLEFFLRNNEKFYCTNEQMGKMLNVNEKTISLAISKLKDNGLIKLSYKMKGGGGKIRFIHLGDDITKSNVATLQNVTYDITKSNDIYNKNIKNKNISYHEIPDLNKDVKIPNMIFYTIQEDTILKHENANPKDWSGQLTYSENDLQKYGKDMLIEFNRYYSETNSKGKQKRQLQKTWSLSGRLATWKRNNEKWYGDRYEKVDYENNLGLFLTKLKTNYEGLKKEVGVDKFFELKKKALEYGAANKLL